MSKIRFALIGCGRIAKNHAAPLQEIANAELVAVCDLQSDRAQSAGERYHVPSYINYHEMLQKESVDVVNILTPSGMHARHALDIIQRYQKHVVLEKPMVLRWKDIDTLKKAARRHHVKIFPVYQNRYNKAVQRVRKDLQSGLLGKPVLGAIRLRWCRPQGYYDRDPWRGTWAMDGGALTNQGIHYIDLLQYLMGDVVSVDTRTATRLVNVEVEDTAVATLQFKSGALGVLEITTATRPEDFGASISVLAEKGTAILTGIACNILETYTPRPEDCASNSEEFPDAYGYGHWPFFKDVLADLLDNKPHPLSIDEGARAIRLLNALYRSAEDNKRVRVADQKNSKRLGQENLALIKRYTTSLPRQ